MCRDFGETLEELKTFDWVEPLCMEEDQIKCGKCLALNHFYLGFLISVWLH